MRPIDADALSVNDVSRGGYHAMGEFEEKIRNAPTLDVITIKWLQDRADSFREKGTKAYMFGAGLIDALIHDWEAGVYR